MSNPEWTEPEDWGGGERPEKITRDGIDFYWAEPLGRYVTIGEDERKPVFTPVEAKSYPVSIFMAGDLSDAESVCREYCDDSGFCVTVTATNYIYTRGEEDGFIVGLINYPRFPRDPDVIWKRAEELAAMLCDNLSQQSYTIQAPGKTVWFSHRPEDTALVAGAGTAETRNVAQGEARQNGPQGDAQPQPAPPSD
jgi:hypothetical protein